MLLLGLSLIALASYASAADTKVSAFSQVQVCTPVNVVISPASSKTSPYLVSVEGDGAVQKAISATVKNGVLTLQTTGSFNTPNPIKVTVRLPADKITGVTVSSATGITVVVDKGFTSKAFSAQVQGSGDLVINGLKATSLKLVNSGTGDIAISGSIGTANVQSSGTGTTYLAGATGPVSVSASGTSSVLISSPNDKVQITGRVSGIASLDYNQGVCKASASDLGQACNKKSVKPPTISALWTCGLSLSGTFGCSTGSTSSSSSSGGGSSTGSTHTSTSGGGSAFASSSSSSSSSSSGSSFSSSSSSDGADFDDDDLIFTTSIPSQTSSSSSSNNGIGSSTLTTNTGKLVSKKCAVATSSLKMA